MEIEIVYVPIDELRPAEYNPRQLTDKQYDDLRRSIERFGLVDPIIVNGAENRKNVVIGGHQRLKIAKDLGIKEVPVVYVNIQDIEKEKELNLRLNKNLGEWDWDMLANFEAEMLVDVGFDWKEIGKYFDIQLEEDNPEEIIPASEEECPVNRGDIWQLGEHRIMCGDSTNIDDVKKLMAGELAQMIFTDPPYNVGYSYDWRSSLHKGKKVAHRFFNDNKRAEEYEEFIKRVFSNAYVVSKNDATVYCWFANKFGREIMNGLEQAGWHLSQQLIWLKNYPVLSVGQDYQRVYEPCWYGWKKGQKRFLVKNPKDRDVINWSEWDLLFDVWKEARDNVQEYIHPTQKPVRLAERALMKSSRPGDIVLDLFAGSGSTLIACEQAGRRCFTMDVDPLYVYGVIRRWEQFTGKKAVRMSCVAESESK